MIEVKNLTKKYGNHMAVRNISFKVEKGIYGLLGPNGAGKSTTMNIITGCLAATSGTVLVDGHDIFEEPVKAKSRIGYLPEQPPLYMDMTPKEYLVFVANAKKVPFEKSIRQIKEVMTITGLVGVRDRLIKNLSKGYKYAGGDVLSDVAWWDANSNYQTYKVAQKIPNELGIYDMTGNVHEWCSDWLSAYEKGFQKARNRTPANYV